MLSDGVKNKEQEDNVKIFDIAELIAQAEGLNK
jgi:heterodisulfide reductase subunit D